MLLCLVFGPSPQKEYWVAHACVGKSNKTGEGKHDFWGVAEGAGAG